MSEQNSTPAREEIRKLVAEFAGPLVGIVSAFEEAPRASIMEHYRTQDGAIFGDTEEGASLLALARIAMGAARVHNPTSPAHRAEALELIRSGSVEEWRQIIADATAHLSNPRPAGAE